MLAAAVTTGALLVLPGAAFATDVDVTLDSPANVEAGATQTYVATVDNIAGADTAETGTITFNVSTGDSVITALTVDTTAAPSMAGVGDVACDVPSATCTLAAGFANAAETFTITVTLQAPKYVDTGNVLEVTAVADGAEAWSGYDTDSFDVTAKGGPSNLRPVFGDSTPSAGLLNEWVALNGTVSTTVTVTNHGGDAHFIVFDPSTWGNASLLSPEPPAFTPTAAVSGAGCAPLPDGRRCELPTLAAGASTTLTIVTSGLTHLGSVDTYLSVDSKGDNGSDSMWWDSADLQVANGETNDVHTAFGNVVYGAGNTPITFVGEFSNVGPNAITNGILEVTGTSFKSTGDMWSGGADQIQSIQSITLSNGATCANKVVAGVAVKDVFHCPLASVPAGTRVSVTIVAIFATAKPNQSASVDMDVHTGGWNPPTSDTSASDWATLNPDKYQELEVSLSSTGVIGMDRLNPITVNVKNNGNTKAENVWLAGELRGVGGTFDTATLPANCTGVSKPMFADCSLGNIEPGATTSIVLNVRAGATLGDLVAIFEAGGGGLLDLNPDNDTLIQVLEVKKAADVPFLGVKIAKSPMRNLTQLVKLGVPAIVTCPGPCKVVGQLQVSRVNAERLGLVKKPRKRNPRASKLITIGTGTKVDADGGRVVVSIKLMRAYKLKVVKLTKPLTVSRVLTVSSTDTATKDASFKKAQAVTFKPAKKPRRVRR